MKPKKLSRKANKKVIIKSGFLAQDCQNQILRGGLVKKK